MRIAPMNSPFDENNDPLYDRGMNSNTQWIKEQVLDRFLRYVKIDTTSDRHIEEIPSTPGQWDLLNLLVTELKELGIQDIDLDEHGYLSARIPSNLPEGEAAPVIGFMAHVDTSLDITGKDVKPQLHENYDLGVINLGSGYKLDPEEHPELKGYEGETIITTDGTTLLGADDKAGVAEIMTAIEWLKDHPEVPHGEIEIIFTPDEETGKGMNLFPLKKLKSVYAYTVDGGEEGEVENECFNAYEVKIIFDGKVIHLGAARGKLVNAVTMAGQFINMLPMSESPEATDGRYGYYCPLEIQGSLDKVSLDVFLRDHDESEIQRRIDAIRKMADTTQGIYPGGTVELTVNKQYTNMKEFLAKKPRGMEIVEQAVREAGIEPDVKIIRGGTDGSRLSEMGIPTPNIFTGGHNYHSRYEWAVLSSMVKTVQTLLNVIELWGKER